MDEILLTINEIHNLSKRVLLANGCDEKNAESVADTVSKADRDGSISHGLFRIPGYIASLRSKKVNGVAKPRLEKISSGSIKIHGDHGFAPLAIKTGMPSLIEITNNNSVGVKYNALAKEILILQPPLKSFVGLF